MKVHTTILSATLLLFSAVCSLHCYAQKPSREGLHRANPQGWFTVLVPSWANEVKTHADVEGGFYESRGMVITWDYWPYEGTPNFMRDRNGKYSRSVSLACPRKGLRRIVITGYPGVEQSCDRVVAGMGLRHIVFVGFDQLPVPEAGVVSNGVFGLSVQFTNRRDRAMALTIVRSLRFLKE